MSRGNKIPFPRGRSAAQGTTIDSGDLQGVHLEGQIVYLPDTSPSDTKVRRSQSDVVAKVVRNKAAIALLPGRAAKWLSGSWGKRVDGYANVVNEEVAGIVDDHLPTAGVQVNDLFYLVIQGPVTVKAPLANSEFSSHVSGGSAGWVQGGWVSGLAAATSGATTAGRLYAITNAHTDVLSDALLNKVGKVLTATTTSNTNASILIDVKLA